jgi:hypothetical protein
MIKQEAVTLVNDNLKLVDTKIQYEGDQFFLKRFVIDQYEPDEYRVIAYLEKIKGVEFTISFESAEDFDIK